MKVKNIELIFFVFIIVAIVVLIHNATAPAEESVPPKTAECPEGAVRDCAKGPCNGTQLCANGTWGRCIVEVICTPGARTPCVIDHCASAYKICNDCGTGYGECMEG